MADLATVRENTDAVSVGEHFSAVTFNWALCRPLDGETTSAKGSIRVRRGDNLDAGKAQCGNAYGDEQASEIHAKLTISQPKELSSAESLIFNFQSASMSLKAGENVV